MIRFLFAACILLASCSSDKDSTLKVAASAVPHAQMLEFVKPDLAEQGVELTILVTDDYQMPNRALANGEIDANFFQHIPFMEEQIKQFNYPIQSLAKIEIEPMGVYSTKIKSLSDLRDHAFIAIPNDPSNEARALLLLQEQGLIKLDQADLLQATILNIVENPKQVKFIEIDAAMLPRSLDDVDIALINTNYALGANLSPEKDALAIESKESPYVNIVAIRSGDENRADLQALKKAMTSEKMKRFIQETYQGALFPVFGD